MTCNPQQTLFGVIKSRMRLTGHVARMGEMRATYRVLVGKHEGKRPLGRQKWGNLRERDHLEDKGVDGRIIRK